MKFLQVCTGFPPDRRGGAENVVLCIREGLTRAGYRVPVVTRLWQDLIDDEDVIPIRPLKGEAMGYLSWGIAASGRTISIRPDLAHFHGLEGAIVCNLVRYSRFKRVMHIHNSLSREAGFLGSPRHRVGYELLRRACLSADLVIAPTLVVKDDTLKHLPGLERDKVIVLPNPVTVAGVDGEFDGLKVKERLNCSNKRVILYFGKIKRSKGIEEICQAYYRMERRDTVALVVAGSPTMTDRFFNHLKSTYPDVIFTGYVENPAVFYRIADLFCIYTSGFEGGETFAIALAEAMRYGVPIVCSENPIFREVTNGLAFFVPPDDPQLLAKAFEDALENQSLARNNAEKAYRLAEELYTPEDFVKRLERIYLGLVRQ